MTTTRVKENTMTLTVADNVIEQAVKTYSMSKKYMITMLQASILNILYHRLNVDESEFVKKSFNNIDYMSCRRKSKNKVIRLYHTCLIAAKEALDKGYLREFYLFFIDKSTNDIIENYKFSFKYPKDDERIQIDRQDLITTTCDLLKILKDLANHDKLNSGIRVKAELIYFDDTPRDYQPPLFATTNYSDSLTNKLSKKGNSVMLGSLCTGFHCLKCRARGKVFNFNDSDSAISAVNEKEKKNPSDLIPRSSKQVTNDTSLIIVDLTDEPDERPPNKKIKKSKLNDELIIKELPEVPGKKEDLMEMLDDKTLRKRSFRPKTQLKNKVFSDPSPSCAESAASSNKELYEGKENENHNQSIESTGSNIELFSHSEENPTEKSDKISRLRWFFKKLEKIDF